MRMFRNVVTGLMALGLAGACATLSNAPQSRDGSGDASGTGAASAPGGVVPLEGTRWKLPMGEDGADGRTVEIKESQDGRYIGRLVDLGRKLTGKLGASIGWEYMELYPTSSPNVYNGLYRHPGEEPQSATFSVRADGSELKCSLEGASWIRVP